MLPTYPLDKLLQSIPCCLRVRKAKEHTFFNNFCETEICF